jgi:23S rRNA (guanosine2251-2'-O)-methyltransferase
VEGSPRDRFITIYGRKPVLEALADPDLAVDKVLLATSARERSAQEIVEAAAARGVRLERLPAARITRISRNGRHDQGVVADVVAPRMRPVAAYAAELDARRAGPGPGGAGLAAAAPGPGGAGQAAAAAPGPGSASKAGAAPGAGERVLVLDGVTNPANVGMILRTATAAGLAGVVLPRQGVPDVGPLVIKASAGVAYRASILRAATVEDALAVLQDAGFMVLGLRGDAPDALWDVDVPERAAFLLGSETHGISPAAARWVHQWVSIPLAAGVESLNVACAASVVAFELARRQRVRVP